MKKQMTVVNGKPMMSSRSIARVTSKEHKDVCRDIRVMLVQLYGGEESDYIRSANLLYETNQCVNCIQYDASNPNAWEYLLDYEHSQCLVAGYDAARRMAIINEWQEMKVELEQPRIAAPAPQTIPASDHILSVARVVAEATASATMKAVMEISGTQVFTTQALPPASSEPVAQVSVATAEPVFTQPAPEFSPVIDLMWAFGISDAACRRLASYSNLPTKLTNGERGHLLVHRESFAEAVFTLIEESTPPTGKRKRWQHPDFGGFTLKVTEANKAAVEAKQ
ncbi:Rha family transcriptional regulator [Serratia liquefaciens]|uniref:DNA-binding protein n=1 Tax=Serratia liquefaciens TaxID=614 RepID=A0A515CSY0_SERLI|nr:Rha family transcriptional regulator [Serratia liquefaciens]QDL31278.1 DNA-binding protein [Serratia liquefaciens]